MKTPEDLPELEISGIQRRNILMVYKESLNNILKHSGASEVEIVMEAADNVFSIYIQDNGKGIHSENCREFSNGLTNMNTRMSEIRGSFRIENNCGTRIYLELILPEGGIKNSLTAS